MVEDISIDEIFDKRFMTNLGSLDVEHYAEILLYLPKKYMNFTKSCNLKTGLEKGNQGEHCYLDLKMVGPPQLYIKKGAETVEITVKEAANVKTNMWVKIRFTDGVRRGTAIVFGRAHPSESRRGNLNYWMDFRANDKFSVYGLVNTEWNNNLSIKDPEIVPNTDKGRIVPRYAGKEKRITPQRIADRMNLALVHLMDDTTTYIEQKMGLSEEDIIKKLKMPFSSLKEFFHTVHRPKSESDIVRVTECSKRMNSFYAYCKSQQHKKLENNPESNHNIDVPALLPDMVKNRLEFTLTEDQRRCIWEILQDLNSDKPMRRLLSGDVGTGKTVCYMLPAAAAQMSGKNVIIMSPNSLLTNQISQEFKKTFPEIPVFDIIGGLKEYPQVTQNSIVIGTSAILTWLEQTDNAFKADLYILDEQQKLGREQKEYPLHAHTNFLEATATAIPRTIALIKYSDMQVSRIIQCPVEKVIHSHIIGSEGRTQAFNKIKETIARGGQVAVLYPRRTREYNTFVYNISDDLDLADLFEKLSFLAEDKRTGEEKIEIEYDPVKKELIFETTMPIHKRIKAFFAKFDDVEFKLLNVLPPSNDEEECRKNVESAFKKWESLFPGRTLMLHGKTKDKLEIVDKMKNNEADIVITSSVIEIGLTIPSLQTVMVVGADIMGASTLHQIRGRLVRHGGEGDFYMYVDKPFEKISEKSMDRLLNVKENNNGFIIAENDMMQRGFGDIGRLGNQQSGFSKGIFPGSKTLPEDVDQFLQDFIENKPDIGLSPV